MAPPSITGGVDWDDLDDADFEDMLNTETSVVSQSTEELKAKNIINGDHFKDYVFHSKDKIGDIQELIAIATNISPYKQYVWFPEAYRSVTDDDVSMTHHWFNALRWIEGYPVDAHGSTISSTQHSLDHYSENNAIVIQVVNIDSIVHKKSKLLFIARSDAESYALIYSNTIQRFFPMMTLPIFNQYLVGKEPDEELPFNMSEAMDVIRKRAVIIDELGKQTEVIVDNNDLITTTTTGIVLTAMHIDASKRADMLKLFEALDVTKSDDIASIDFYTVNTDQREIRMRKLAQKDQYRSRNDADNDLFAQSVLPYSIRSSLVRSNAIVITYFPRPEYTHLVLVLNENGAAWIKSQPNHSHLFSKTAFIDFIQKLIDPLLNAINSFENVFTGVDRFALIGKPIGSLKYLVSSSSTNLSFKFAVAYQKLIDMIISKLLASGFVKPLSIGGSRIHRETASFLLSYAVSRDTMGVSTSMIDIRNFDGLAIISLLDLDVDETNFYIDVIGRLIKANKDKLKASSEEKTNLAVIDPVLFRPTITSDGYSRICQKKFQPIISNKNDPKAVEYRNFTFNRPEYYTCPTKKNPILGFIQGKHAKGYCLPCCRKTKQSNIDQLKQSCVSNNDEIVQTAKMSAYKMEYPNIDVPNRKIATRRIALPDYACRLLELDNVVANGSVLLSWNDRQCNTETSEDKECDMNPLYKSHLQSSRIIASIYDDTKRGPMFESFREFILDAIASIKDLRIQNALFKNETIRDQYATPQQLVVDLEESFLKNTVLQHSKLSDVQWNDLIIFIANLMGLNVILLSDERNPNKNVQLSNLHDIDISKPVLIILKRTTIEWASKNSNTRALYLPITHTNFKLTKDSVLTFAKFDISKALSKIKRMTIGKLIKRISKQFTIENIKKFAATTKQYKLLQDLSSQKLAVIGIGKKQLVSTIAAETIVFDISGGINSSSSVDFKQVIGLINDYNNFVIDDSPDSKDLINRYKVYLQVAIKTDSKYEFPDCSLFLLKIEKFIINNDMVIGMIVNTMNSKMIIATELMFISPIKTKSIQQQLKQAKADLQALHSRINARAIASFPFMPSLFIDDATQFIEWLNNPLTVRLHHNKICKSTLQTTYNKGMYLSEIYRFFVKDLVHIWESERSVDFEKILEKELKAMGNPPYVQTKIDKMIDMIVKKIPNYDLAIVRITVNRLVEEINMTEKSSSGAIKRINHSRELTGFDLKNVFKWPKALIKSKVTNLMKTVTTKSSIYPEFDFNIPINNQQLRFYDQKSKKLIVHSEIASELAETMVADLINPFRREYILNIPLLESEVSDVQAHIGEIIYIQYINK